MPARRSARPRGPAVSTARPCASGCARAGPGLGTGRRAPGSCSPTRTTWSGAGPKARATRRGCGRNSSAWASEAAGRRCGRGPRGAAGPRRTRSTRRRRLRKAGGRPRPLGWPACSRRRHRLPQAHPAELPGQDRAFLDRLLAEAPALAEVRDLARGFAALVRKEGTRTLDGGLAAAAGTPLGGFAEGLGKDLAAVRAALETRWSTGPVEGQISRLKTIKRTMSGRAGFELLRTRVLHAA